MIDNMATLRPLTAFVAVAVCVLSGCDSDTVGPDGNAAHGPIEEAVEHGCKHFTDGPAKAFTLPNSPVDPPDLSLLHHRHDLTLSQTKDGKRGGRGIWKNSEAGDAVLMLSADVALVVSDSAGAEVKPERTLTKPSGCAAVAVAHAYDLGIGTYTWKLGPTDASTLQLVFQHADHDAQAHE